MSAIHKQYSSRGFEAVFAAVNLNPEVKWFIDRFEVPFPVGTGDADKARLYMEFTMTSPTPVPWLVFLDRQGTIRYQFTGNDPLFNGGEPPVRAIVEKLLAEKPPAAAPKKKKK
ncbi:MAG TPA: hypothetical protein VM120_08830 [Bryobacteraceae bacterium]|nr:hypothetical protein [Bryobacteraceae bacterium]